MILLARSCERIYSAIYMALNSVIIRKTTEHYFPRHDPQYTLHLYSTRLSWDAFTSHCFLSIIKRIINCSCSPRQAAFTQCLFGKFLQNYTSPNLNLGPPKGVVLFHWKMNPSRTGRSKNRKEHFCIAQQRWFTLDEVLMK